MVAGMSLVREALNALRLDKAVANGQTQIGRDRRGRAFSKGDRRQQAVRQPRFQISNQLDARQLVAGDGPAEHGARRGVGAGRLVGGLHDANGASCSPS